jgi:hypothetical protein
MLTYQIHTIESAPAKSKPLLELFTEAVGFVPSWVLPALPSCSQDDLQTRPREDPMMIVVSLRVTTW